MHTHKVSPIILFCAVDHSFSVSSEGKNIEYNLTCYIHTTGSIFKYCGIFVLPNSLSDNCEVDQVEH